MENPTQQFERRLLLNSPQSGNENTFFNEIEILNGEYKAALKHEFCVSTIAPLMDENFENNLKENIAAHKDDQIKWFCTAVSSFLYFIQNNWTGELEQPDLHFLLPLRKIASSKLTLGDQLNENVVKPELLYLAKAILCNNEIRENFPTSAWWSFRTNYIHQQILDELSVELFDESENLIKVLADSNLKNDAMLNTLFSLEVTFFYLYYTRMQSSEKYLKDCKTAAQLTLQLESALGKRTRYQLHEKAQLYLKAKVGKELFPFRKCETLPKVVNLSDDLRLEKVEFTEKREKVELGSVEEAIVMAEFFQLKLFQPKDELTDEEIAPYLDCIIENTQNWALKLSALFERCILEVDHKRTIERSLSQIEHLIHQVNGSQTPVSLKMDLFFVSGMKPIWILKQNLANVMLNLGLVKGAMELYLSLSLWVDLIVCYTILEMKHKAAEIIKQELTKKPTVKLWCLLGDVTQEVEHYETAWKLSEEKSSRVQRHWGLYYYSKRNYKEAIPHLQRSVELNNIQENVWVRLGFAALQVEDWKLAASAYRKYCALEQTNFQAWNNLAKAYIKLGDKPRAWHTLQDAIKCNYDKWEVWDNLMVVSIDLGHFSEVIRCYDRILDIKNEQHLDVQILTLLARAIINDLKDADGNPARQYLQKSLKLFGRLTASITTDADVWRLYAELTLLKNNEIDNQKAAQYFQRAYRAAVANPRWFRTVQDANKVLDTCARLGEASITALKNCEVPQKRAILGSAKLSLQSVVRKMKDLMWEDKSGIAEHFQTVEEHLQIVLDELEKLKSVEN